MNLINSNLESKLSNPPIEIMVVKMVVNDKYLDVYDTETKLQALLELHLTKYHIVVSYFKNIQTSNTDSSLYSVPRYLESFLKKQSNCISLLQSNYNVQTKVTKYYNLTGIKVK